MEPILIKDHCIKSYGSSVFIKSITKCGDIYTGCISNKNCNQNTKIDPNVNIVYYNKRDINGIFLEESTGNELHSIFYYKILGVEIEKKQEKKQKGPMSFIGCEI
jgi:hypothetical protein